MIPPAPARVLHQPIPLGMGSVLPHPFGNVLPWVPDSQEMNYFDSLVVPRVGMHVRFDCFVQ